MIFNIIGVILLFKFGLPENINREGSIGLSFVEQDESMKKKAGNYDRFSLIAIILLVLGFIMQIWSNYIT